MAILKVARLGHPVLRQQAEAVKPGRIETPEFQRIVEDMVETMREYIGVGLAAPQVHLLKRILVYEVQENERYPGHAPVPLRVLINPEIELLGDEKEADWEGCLSIPNIRGLVPRATRIGVRALNEKGEPVEYEAADFEARVIQHEVDHLNGVLFPDRMPNLASLTFLEEYQRYWAPGSGGDAE